jgi:hypothetical protein
MNFKTVSQNPPPHPPTPDEIQTAAFEDYRSAGSVPDHDLDHWLAAEQRLQNAYEKLKDEFQRLNQGLPELDDNRRPIVSNQSAGIVRPG